MINHDKTELPCCVSAVKKLLWVLGGAVDCKTKSVLLALMASYTRAAFLLWSI